MEKVRMEDQSSVPSDWLSRPYGGYPYAATSQLVSGWVRVMEVGSDAYASGTSLNPQMEPHLSV